MSTAFITDNGASETPTVTVARRRGRPANTASNTENATPKTRATNYAKLLEQKLFSGPTDAEIAQQAWESAQQFAEINGVVESMPVLMVAYKNYVKYNETHDSAESTENLFAALRDWAGNDENLNRGSIKLVSMFQRIYNKAVGATADEDED